MEVSTLMDTSHGPPAAHHLTHPDLTQPGPYGIDVHHLTAKVFLNRPVEDLIPVRFLRMAERTPTVQRKAWIFRSGVEDARDIDLNEWSKIDIRYRGVFKTLAKVPCFSKGLWDGGCELCQVELEQKKPWAQAQVVYALLEEIGDMLDIKRSTADGKKVFFLKPRLLAMPLEYWTGYREKHFDAPETAGFLALDFSPDGGIAIPILPVSTTMEEESLASALNGKFKLMLGQLLLHVRPLPLPGDKLPDQEIFLVGQHGSKLHLMRAFFPGQKMSSLWCRRELPGPSTRLPPDLGREVLSVSVPSSPVGMRGCHDPEEEEGDNNAPENNNNINDTSSTTTVNVHPEPGRRRSNSTRFYAPPNIERLRQHLEQTKLDTLDHEPNLHTFRVLATREFDLWHKDDFAAAVHVLTALHLYLLSGQARCGTLQETFEDHPYREDDNNHNQSYTPNPNYRHANDYSWNNNYEAGSDISRSSRAEDEHEEEEEERHRRLRADIEAEEMRLAEKEEELRREELIQRLEQEEAVRVREAMRWAGEDRIGSLRDSRRPWWDFVWEDREGEGAGYGYSAGDDADADTEGEGEGETETETETQAQTQTQNDTAMKYDPAKW
ncbi:hypothetical protein NUU61_005521 [Penicillium alfredii]|uniref:Uncharacterized protein n=1 Tax=Penicillium alfredii TaxID=1506179 RepID=A0A9W9K7X2_9EURO|nr:uncharacterized protein NUU61_005521 [Penicillium alfredii]KAJ5096165.1 hypothetical protein NUU61_005521 [Penicillium alfredii]